MRALIQRVSRAKVEVAGENVGDIGPGLLVLLGISPEDSEKEVQYLARKLGKLRIFSDDEGKMNLSVQNVSGSVLVVSQFTLYADASRGNRPSYIGAAVPEHAEALYKRFCEALSLTGLPVATGIFGADMQISLENNGPVTILLDTAELMSS